MEQSETQITNKLKNQKKSRKRARHARCRHADGGVQLAWRALGPEGKKSPTYHGWRQWLVLGDGRG